VVDKVAPWQVFFEYFDFPCQSSFHQILHHHNQPRQIQQANEGPQCQVDLAGLHPALREFKKSRFEKQIDFCLHLATASN
jgi:hypothetical protein